VRRYRYLIAYDISDAKRWRKVYKLIQGLGIRLQYSVFVADLTVSEVYDFIIECKKVIDCEVDKLLVVKLGQEGDSGDMQQVGAVVELAGGNSVGVF
jgi:CRISPR-associated protein Cas2